MIQKSNCVRPIYVGGRYICEKQELIDSIEQNIANRDYQEELLVHFDEGNIPASWINGVIDRESGRIESIKSLYRGIVGYDYQSNLSSEFVQNWRIKGVALDGKYFPKNEQITMPPGFINNIRIYLEAQMDIDEEFHLEINNRRSGIAKTPINVKKGENRIIDFPLKQSIENNSAICIEDEIGTMIYSLNVTISNPIHTYHSEDLGEYYKFEDGFLVRYNNDLRLKLMAFYWFKDTYSWNLLNTEVVAPFNEEKVSLLMKLLNTMSEKSRHLEALSHKKFELASKEFCDRPEIKYNFKGITFWTKSNPLPSLESLLFIVK